MDYPLDLILRSPQKTFQMGAILGELALAGDVIALQGGLGAGKTLFTQGVARGLGIGADTRITSPTFGLVHEYQGRLPLFHLDLYRLAGEDDIEAAGLTDYLYADGLAVIEWAERLGYLMPAQRLDIILKIMGENQRRACLTPRDGNWQERLVIFSGRWGLYMKTKNSEFRIQNSGGGSRGSLLSDSDS